MTDRTRRLGGNSARLWLVLTLVAVAGLLVTGLARGDSSLKARIALDRSRVRTGGVIRGRLILDNTGSTPRVLLRGCLTNGRFGIGLRAADGYQTDPGFTAVGCSPLQALVVAKPGVSIYRFKIPARYDQCSQNSSNQQPKGSPNWTPLCLRDSHRERNIMPPLQAGKYTARFVPDGRWQGPSVKPAALTVTRAG